MPSFDAASMDGEYRFGRSLKTEEFVEQKRVKRYSSQETASIPPGRYSSDYVPSETDAYLDYTSSELDDSDLDYYTERTSRLPQERTSTGYNSTLNSNSEYLGRSTAVAATADVAFTTTPVETASALSRQIQHFLSDQVTPIRLASHLAVLAVAAVVLIVSQVDLPDWQFSLRNLPDDGLLTAQTLQGLPAAEGNAFTGTGNSIADATEAIQRAVVPFTENPVAVELQSTEAPAPQVAAPLGQRQAIETYTVKSGDTVLGIASKFNIKPETILWANSELEVNPDLLRINDRLVILPVDGALHVVQSGDTLHSIAARYKVTAQAIAEHPLNQLESIDTPIAIGTQLIIPGGTKPYITRQVATYEGPMPETAVKGSGALGWPAAGSITQTFWGGHRAIDIGAHTGTAVTAADNGYVIASKAGGWNNGYGNMVMVDHGNGYVTLYAHLNSIYVRQGENISKGQQIGTVGNTGNSTGPHLHFEVRYQGVARNPFTYLP